MTRFSAFRVLAACVLALLAAGGDAHAGIAVERPLPSAAQVDAMLEAAFASSAPELPIEAVRFNDERARTCATPAEAEPQVRAVLAAPQYKSPSFQIANANDVTLIAGVLRARGVRDDAIAVLADDTLTRASLIERLGTVLGCTRAGDQVLFFFSGHSILPLGSPETREGAGVIERLVAQHLCEEKPSHQPCAEWAQRPETRRLVRWRADRLPGDVLLTDFQAPGHGADRYVFSGLTDIELANFVTQVRNRGADAFVFLDTSFAAATRLGERQRLVRQDLGWQANGAARDGDLAETGLALDRLVLLDAQAGGFAAFYASDAAGHATDTKDADRKVGLFSFAISRALQADATPDARTLARTISRSVAQIDVTAGRSGHPVFEASSAALAVLAPRKVPVPNADDIRVIEPEPKRGAIDVSDQQTLRVVARYVRPADVAIAMIDNAIVPMAADGTFEASLPAPERNESIVVSVLTHGRQLVTRKISLNPPALPQALTKTGRRFALLIGNAAYQDKRFEPLTTPHDDVRAVADVLSRDFGFRTALPARAGQETPLVLLDATRNQINDALDALTEELTADDQLLIYYGGHGVYEEVTDTAYWVPVDARHGRSGGFLAATEITRALKRMKARNILVVSDSCYAGALVRSGDDAMPVTATDRLRTLTKLARQVNRVLIASGGKEPVRDTGRTRDGKQHSVFAGAFLDALGSMDLDAFSAQELYAARLLPAVSGKAAQEPQHKVIRDSGHEGGDFVFVRERK